MKNKLIDLNNHLFAQIERLGEEDIKDEQLEKEMKRTVAITSVAKEIVSNARLALDAQIKAGDTISVTKLPAMIT